MADQPTALRLADILQHKLPSIECLERAAAELRRLHAELETYKRLYEQRGKALARPCIACGHAPAVIHTAKAEGA